MIQNKRIIYLNANGIESLGKMESPNKEVASTILNNTLLTISPWNVHDIKISNIWDIIKNHQ